MSRLSPQEREAILREMRSPDVAAAFAASERACAEWDRAHPVSIDGILDWIDQLRALFGEPPVDATPWRGDDFRI